jgi:hypothetical protein
MGTLDATGIDEPRSVDTEQHADASTRSEGRSTCVGGALPSQSLIVMAMLAMHPRPQQVMRRFRDLLETWRNDPSEASLQERLLAPSGNIPSTIEQVINLLRPHDAEGDELSTPLDMSTPAIGFAGDVDAHERMHDFFVLALLAAHPHPAEIRCQFRIMFSDLAASHSRFAFGDDFVLTVRRSLLRFDHMLNLVLAARKGGNPAPESRAASATTQAPVTTEAPADTEPQLAT